MNTDECEGGRLPHRREKAGSIPNSKFQISEKRQRQATGRVVLGGLGLIDEAVVNGVEGELETVGHAELIENVVEVILYGLFADEELFANLAIAKALRDQLDDFLLAVAQERLFTALTGFSGFLEGVDDLGSHAIVEPDFTVIHLADALDKQVAGGLLKHDSAGAQTHRAHHVAVVFGGGEHDHARRRGFEVQFFQDAEAVFFGHAQIEEQNVRLELREHLGAFDAIRSLAHNLDFIRAVQQFAQTIPKDGVVVRDQDPNRLFCFTHLQFNGISMVRRAPCPGLDSTVSVPPTLRVLSFIEIGPRRSRSSSSLAYRP